MKFHLTLSKKAFWLSLLILFVFTGFVMPKAVQAASVANYNLSKAPKEMKGVNIPDFLAFATDNKEKTPLSVMGEGFFPAEISCTFDLNEAYLNKYHGKISAYARFLESLGFKYNAGWEGYYHFDKKWKGYYVMVTVGTYAYETSGIKIGITLTKDRYVFPSHHNDTAYRN